MRHKVLIVSLILLMLVAVPACAGGEVATTPTPTATPIPTPTPTPTLTPTPGPAPKIIYVPDDYPTIQGVVDAASPGDTIVVRAGTYTENVLVNKQVTIQSETGDYNDVIITAGDSSQNVIRIENVDGVNISGLTVTGAGAGIYLHHANNGNISNVNASNNDDYGIYLGYSSNNTLSGNTVSNNDDYGIYLYGSSNNTLSGNTVSNNDVYGIYLGSSSQNTLSGNTASNNGYYGIYLASSSNNTLSGNTVSNNYDGIYLGTSPQNTLSGNTVSNNDCYGIYLASSPNNTLSGNTVSNNYGGISLGSSSNNTLSGNTVSNNYRYGIRLPYSSNNTIYLNDFVDSIHNASSYDLINTWNSPEEMTYVYNSNTYTNFLGNHWSDYTGTDADGDGIGDSPYSIDGDSDNYPLMEPFENYGIGAISPETYAPTLKFDNDENYYPTGPHEDYDDVTNNRENYKAGKFPDAPLCYYYMRTLR